MVLTIDRSGAFPVAKLTGEWRATDGQDYRDELHPLVAEAGAKLVLDLSGLRMIDSSGLAALISVVTHARLSHARAMLLAPSPFVAGVLGITNLDQWFEICADLDEVARLLDND